MPHGFAQVYRTFAQLTVLGKLGNTHGKLARVNNTLHKGTHTHTFTKVYTKPYADRTLFTLTQA